MVRLLCTGDLHIGRRPSRLPAHVDLRPHAASVAWTGVVEEAIRREVHAVVLTGDVVDRENRYYEALGPLEAGLRHLDDAGIRTFAVAGNHDFDVFPEVVASLAIDGFHLLGARGQWERVPLPLKGETRLFLDGWSFPSQHVRTSPMDGYEWVESDVPVLGVLHADLDPRVGSRYGPIRSADLDRAGPVFWLLGHIHVPHLGETVSGVGYLYPGSPQPLDPGETGPRGPWLIQVDPEGEVSAEQVWTATVRYETVEVDVDGVDDPADIKGRMHESMRDLIREGLGDRGPLEHLVCRLSLTGHTELHRSLSGITADAPEDLELSIDEITATVERVDLRTRPAVDLEKLAGFDTPPGVLARVVRALDAGEETEEVRALLEVAERKVHEVDHSATYAPVFDHDEELEPVERVDLRALVREQALLLISELESQKAGEA